MYGGVTDDGFGLMVETSKSGRNIVRIATGLTLHCTSGVTFSAPDGWSKLSVKKRKFSATFGPMTERNHDGRRSTFKARERQVHRSSAD